MLELSFSENVILHVHEHVQYTTKSHCVSLVYMYFSLVFFFFSFTLVNIL